MARSERAFLSRVRDLVVSVALAGCELPPAPIPVLGPTALSDTGTTLIARDHRVLTLVENRSGSPLWHYTPPKPAPPRYGVRPEPYLTCSPALLPNRNVVVYYTDGIVALLHQSGAERWTHTYRTRRAWTLCPAIMPDSGVIFVDPREPRGRTLLIKLDREGVVQWESLLPEVGLADGSPQVDGKSGDVTVQTRTHIVCVSPTGKINWIRERSSYAEK